MTSWALSVLGIVVHLKIAAEWKSIRRNGDFKHRIIKAAFDNVRAERIDDINAAYTAGTKEARKQIDKEFKAFKKQQEKMITARNQTWALYQTVRSFILSYLHGLNL